MSNPFAKLLASVSLVVALGLVTGCSAVVPTDPNAYPFPAEETLPLVAGAKVDVVNGYPAPAAAPLGPNMSCDMKEFTETAAAILRRELSKKGLVVGPGADKQIVLRVVSPMWTQGFGFMRGLVSVEAQLGTATINVEGEARSGGNAMRVYNAALMRSMVSLMKREELQAYLSKP